MTRGGGLHYLIFSIAARLFAIRLLDVKRVIPLDKIHDVPLKKPFFMGLVEFEGKAIPLFNVKYALGMEENNSLQESIIAVQNIEGDDIGFLMEKIHKVLSLHINEFEDMESPGPGISKRIIVDGGEILLLDSMAMLSEMVKK